jgi:hypothetical protein
LALLFLLFSLLLLSSSWLVVAVHLVVSAIIAAVATVVAASIGVVVSVVDAVTHVVSHHADAVVADLAQDHAETVAKFIKN